MVGGEGGGNGIGTVQSRVGVGGIIEGGEETVAGTHHILSVGRSVGH